MDQIVYVIKKTQVFDIINKYKDHPNITKIKELVTNKNSFEFPEANTEDINKIIKELNPNKAAGPDCIPIKVIKASANIIDSHFNIYHKWDCKTKKYSEDAKKALVRPICKEDDRDQIKNYRPVSLLNGLSEISERSGLTTEALTFLYFYLKRRQQRVRLNDAGIIF